jgi:adenylosuccinate synthase
MNVPALVGGQFGSEGKGLIAGNIAKDYDNHVRVGAANAGHTVYTRSEMVIDQELAQHEMAAVGSIDHLAWEKHVLQSIPCAAYANPQARLFIGPGALINVDILEREIMTWRQWGDTWDHPWIPIVVDPRAQVVQQLHKDMEAQTDLAARIGSTSATAREGIGAAQAMRVMRDKFCVEARDDDTLSELEAQDLIQFGDVPFLLQNQHSILMEGTQGADLSLTTGRFPYVTSRNTTAAGLLADCGVAPGRLDRVILVCRAYPIRVAGPSGPFWSDSTEIEWGDIGVDPQKEKTTVTKKIRRVATFSLAQVRHAAMINGATEIALTFCDYVDPAIAGVDFIGATASKRVVETRYPKVWEMIDRIEEAVQLPVTMLGTGPHSVTDLIWED